MPSIALQRGGQGCPRTTSDSHALAGRVADGAVLRTAEQELPARMEGGEPPAGFATHRSRASGGGGQGRARMPADHPVLALPRISGGGAG
jgi:hypothetical protein